MSSAVPVTAVQIQIANNGDPLPLNLVGASPLAGAPKSENPAQARRPNPFGSGPSSNGTTPTCVPPGGVKHRSSKKTGRPGSANPKPPKTRFRLGPGRRFGQPAFLHLAVALPSSSPPLCGGKQFRICLKTLCPPNTPDDDDEEATSKMHEPPQQFKGRFTQTSLLIAPGCLL